MQEQNILALIDNIISVKPMFYRILGKPVPMNSDITPGAYYAMVYLKKHESLSMTDLGKMLEISKPNVTALINKLIVKGFVIRTSDQQDRRIIMIRLSAKGIQFIEKLAAFEGYMINKEGVATKTTNFNKYEID